MIKRLIFTIVALSGLSFALAQFPERAALPGKTYALINPPAQLIQTADNNRVEVVEIFSYTCTHCYRLEEPIAQWLKTKSEAINFVRLPISSGGTEELYSKTYYTLEAMKEIDKGHAAFFDAIWKKRMRFQSKEGIAKFMGSIGIDDQNFLKIWDSFAVKTSYNRAIDLTIKQYKVDYTPIFIIDGKYLIDGSTSQASSYEGIVEAVNKLALEVLEEKKTNTNRP